MNQNFQHFEVIVVDDCSTDKSLQIVKSFENHRLKIIQHTKNKGLSASRNTGIANASTEYVVFLDADDLLKKQYLEKIQELISEFPKAGIFATNYEQIYAKNVAVAPKIAVKVSRQNVLITNFFAVSLQQPIYCQSSLCVRKSVFKTIGLYDESIKYAEDVDFNIRANCHFLLAYSSEKFVEYVMVDSSQITKNNIANKKIPDFDQYESWTKQHPDLKKYLDVNRYMLAVVCKRQGDLKTFRKLKKGMSRNSEISGLNYKQRLLLNVPRIVLNTILWFKNLLLKSGFRATSF